MRGTRWGDWKRRVESYDTFQIGNFQMRNEWRLRNHKHNNWFIIRQSWSIVGPTSSQNAIYDLSPSLHLSPPAPALAPARTRLLAPPMWLAREGGPLMCPAKWPCYPYACTNSTGCLLPTTGGCCNDLFGWSWMVFGVWSLRDFRLRVYHCYYY